ncbi:hypothetical protein [Nitrososphaera sp.]|uniref:DUF7336 domain-containing protein n=1 Tax=Nitrososphaera sp. TaxID=1971748 RepID=UPI00307DD570
MKVWVVFKTTPYGNATDIFGVFDSQDGAEKARKQVSDRGHWGGRIIERELNQLSL